MGKLGDAAKAIAQAAARKAASSAYEKLKHNVKKGASKHYCPHTDSKRHHMVSADMGQGWRVLHCDYCGWFDHKSDRHQHFLG